VHTDGHSSWVSVGAVCTVVCIWTELLQWVVTGTTPILVHYMLCTLCSILLPHIKHPMRLSYYHTVRACSKFMHALQALYSSARMFAVSTRIYDSHMSLYCTHILSKPCEMCILLRFVRNIAPLYAISLFILLIIQVLDSYVVVSAFTLVFLSPVGGLLCIGRIAVKAAAYILPALGIRGNTEERALAAAAVRFKSYYHPSLDCENVY
jgi:hypothetical protein